MECVLHLDAVPDWSIGRSINRRTASHVARPGAPIRDAHSAPCDRAPINGSSSSLEEISWNFFGCGNILVRSDAELRPDRAFPMQLVADRKARSIESN